MRAAGARRLLAIVALVWTAGCGAPIELSKALTVDVSRTGWFDAGIVGGNNKLVPSVSFSLRNVSDQKLPVLQVNALFRRVSESAEWGSGFMTVAGTEGLAPGAGSTALTIRSQLGYTGTEPRATMLANSNFVDAKVELFAKYGSGQWTRLGEYPITRQLIEP